VPLAERSRVARSRSLSPPSSPAALVTYAPDPSQLVYIALLAPSAVLTVMSLANADERAGLLSAFYVECCLVFSLPAVLMGFLVPIVGLRLAADVYGAAVILLALASLLAAALSRGAR
jgi:hypothetical protein